MASISKPQDTWLEVTSFDNFNNDRVPDAPSRIPKSAKIMIAGGLITAIALAGLCVLSAKGIIPGELGTKMAAGTGFAATVLGGSSILFGVFVYGMTKHDPSILAHKKRQQVHEEVESVVNHPEAIIPLAEKILRENFFSSSGMSLKKKNGHLEIEYKSKALEQSFKRNMPLEQSMYMRYIEFLILDHNANSPINKSDNKLIWPRVIHP